MGNYYLPHRLLVLCLFLTVYLTGCSGTTTVILLPEADGSVGHVSVSNGGGAVEITKSGERTVARSWDRAPENPEVLSAEEIERKYSRVLSALPEKPMHFILYFHNDSTQLVRSADSVVKEVLATINSRNSQSIDIIGHTDTAGDEQYNLELSLYRAKAIERLLVNHGVDSNHIDISSHGEYNPLVKTGDNVHEPRNRRVEVVVR